MTENNLTTSIRQRGYGRDFFQQESPRLGNQYLEDSYLLELLPRVVPEKVYEQIKGDLTRFGDRVMGDILQYGRASEANPPKLVQYDAWGRRVSKIIVDEGWKILQDISAQEGLVAIGYERPVQEYSRLYQYLKVYLFACSSAVFDCPLSMTDGGARLLELYGDKEMMQGPFKHFTTRDPKNFWTSGQWVKYTEMTEKTGGSDVANSETIAVGKGDGKNYDISGYKFFTSATTANSAILLARDKESAESGFRAEGSRGLSAFYINIRDKQGELNNIIIHKLKNKFGTKAVPTAELELLETPSRLIGAKGRGVPVIASILNITRIHNVIHSVGTMRRSVAIARDFAHRRMVFSSKLAENKLYLSTLAEMEIELRAGMQFFLDVTILLGKSECLAKNDQTESLLRILTPLSKLYTAKQSITVASEVMECLGGTGYMEDSDIPRLFRDTQVTSIWEGTTNVLSMDVWRSIKTHKSLDVMLDVVKNRINVPFPEILAFSHKVINDSLKQVEEMAKKVTVDGDIEFVESNAKKFAFFVSQVYIASLFFEHALKSKRTNNIDAHVSNRWCFTKLQGSRSDSSTVSFAEADQEWREIDRILALDIDDQGNARGTGDHSTNPINLGTLRARY
ncbi:putative acyl-CoA dehydrogenase [Cavenderia fasciculata]|uniref:Acyl-CoA dehydrogenase n=1 Tax=Cavenderia fasciculata TaxID=261658 RepID=F4PJU0_CACFS|nr:putative acyl-CoA dehydrogenase [Cavenderia fasciculata]EGG23864.1 putative acyl-CoA dehydrogenase [Cavenderia fasciculata]|eukprot:XP_004361715.1 putative acyl-CoA dehydrogenase [Cavenderia fasciculata]